MDKIKLQKFMANAGISSRRKCEDLIKDGKVKVNDKIATIGIKIDPQHDIITLNNKKIELNKRKFYIMLNKPRGFLTSMSDDRGRKCITELVKDIPARIYPVGRLDKDSEGLILLTNDGDFANKVIHPSNNKWKTYRVILKGLTTPFQIENMCKGIIIDGKKTKPAKVRLLEYKDGKSITQISIQEGRNRQIRKMCEQLGIQVLRLKRISIGNLKLENLPVGKWRHLKNNEILSFKN